MNYKKHYNLLIESRWDREIDLNEYYERHHILPRCVGGDNDTSNLIHLTVREHYVAHWLLVKEAFKSGTKTEQYKLGCAFHRMCYGNGKIKRNFSSFDYDIARKTFIKSISGENSPNYGKKHTKESIKKMCKSKQNVSKETRKKMSESSKGKIFTEEHRKRLSESLKGRKGRKHTKETRKKMSEGNSGENNPNYGKSPTEETRKKISESLKGEKNPFFGRKHTEESKKKMSEGNSGENNPNYGKSPTEETRKKISESAKKRKKVTCPHCGKIGGVHVMKRWHFDNCKLLNISP